MGNCSLPESCSPPYVVLDVSSLLLQDHKLAWILYVYEMELRGHSWQCWCGLTCHKLLYLCQLNWQLWFMNYIIHNSVVVWRCALQVRCLFLMMAAKWIWISAIMNDSLMWRYAVTVISLQGRYIKTLSLANAEEIILAKRCKVCMCVTKKWILIRVWL